MDSLTSTLDLLLSMGRDLQRKDPDRAASCLRQAAELGRAISSPSSECRALLLLGGVETLRERFDDAQRCLERALELARGEKDDLRASGALKGLGVLCLAQGRAQESETHLRQALEGIQADDAREEAVLARADLLDAFSRLYNERGDLTQAFHFVQQAYELRRRLGDPVEIARSQNNLAILYYRLGKLQEAVANLRQVRQLWLSLDDERGAAIAASNLGQALVTLREFEEATQLLLESRRFFESMGEKQALANELRNLGMLSYFQGKVKEAEEFYGESLRLHEKLENAPGQAHTLSQLARLAYERGRPEEAIAFADRALALHRSAGVGGYVIKPACARGLALLELGRLEEARGVVDELPAGDAVESSEAHVVLDIFRAHLQLAAGEGDAARESAERALARAEAKEDREEIATCLAVLGEVHLALGEWENAKDRLAAAERSLRGSSGHHIRARVLLAQGELLARSSSIEAGAERFRRADGELERIGNDRARIRLLIRMADLFRESDVSQAERCLREAEETARRSGLETFHSELRETSARQQRAAAAGAAPLAPEAGQRFGAPSQRSPGDLMAAALLLALASHPGAGAARGAEDESAPLDEPPDGEHRLEGLVGASDAMQTVYRMIRQVAPRDTTVLLLGESGTGKELAARALHERSDRNRGPFLVINCPSIPRELIESELFGHEKGAFTGALATRRGKIELAHEGTLFLDEVGDLAAGAQAKLLRFLEEREFQRVGGTENRTVNVRIVSATSRDLEEAMRQGAFREDLYYRLNVVPIRMPGLRERKEDIPLLVRHFLTRFSTPGGERLRIAGGALDLLRAYDWPGNVRELRNTLEYMIAIAGSERLDEGHLPAPVRQAAAAKDAHVGAVAGAEVESGNGMPHEGAGHGLAGPMRPGETLQSRLTRLEAGIIRRTLEEEGWNQSAAARRLGILESKIRHRMRHYGIRRPEGA